MAACVRRKRGTSETVFASQSEEICAPCESWIGDVEYDFVEGAAKESAHEVYCFHLLQFLKPTCHIDLSNFCIKMQGAMTEEGLDRVVFSDAPTFHISVKVHRHNVGYWKFSRNGGTWKGFPKDQRFFSQCPHGRFMGLSFSVMSLWRE